jgi:hypothetical protein
VVENNFEPYCSSNSKTEKSIILSDIIGDIYAENPNTATTKFVRFNKKRGLWFEIGDAAIKQKIGQTIREMVCQRDPKKRAAKAVRRNKNYKARSMLVHSKQQKPQKKRTTRTTMVEVLYPEKQVSANKPLSYGAITLKKPPTDMVPILCYSSSHTTKSTLPARTEKRGRPLTHKPMCLADLAQSSLSKSPPQFVRSDWLDNAFADLLEEYEADYSTVFLSDVHIDTMLFSI